jgi:hypothetical protein
MKISRLAKIKRFVLLCFQKIIAQSILRQVLGKQYYCPGDDNKNGENT